MPSIAEHAAIIHDTLRKVERATRKHHKALQDFLEEHGPALIGDIAPFGGGTDKPPPEDE